LTNSVLRTIIGGMEPVDVLVVTAVPEAFAAMLDAGGGASAWTTEGPTAFQDIEAAGGGNLRVAVAPAMGMVGGIPVGQEQALIAEYEARCLARCGVCAGKRGDVALGDVIVADRLWKYDEWIRKFEVATGKRMDHEQGDIELYRLHPPAWKQAAERFEVDANAAWLTLRPRSYEAQGDWILERVLRGADPLADADCKTKCADWDKVLARLWKKELLEDGTLTLTAAGRKHVGRVLLLNRGELPEVKPLKVHVGPIASVMRDDEVFALLSDSVHNLLGVKMASAEIWDDASELSYSVVTMGVMDYADADESICFKSFAARASAEVLLAFVRLHVPPRVKE
jgi:nucleoside phosphorylase